MNYLIFVVGPEMSSVSPINQPWHIVHRCAYCVNESHRSASDVDLGVLLIVAGFRIIDFNALELVVL